MSNITEVVVPSFRLVGNKDKQTIIFQTVKGFLDHWDEFQWYWKNMVGKKYYVLSSFKYETIRYVKINAVDVKLQVEIDGATNAFLVRDSFDAESAELELNSWDQLFSRLSELLYARYRSDGQDASPSSFATNAGGSVHNACLYPLGIPTQSYAKSNGKSNRKGGFPIGDVTLKTIDDFNVQPGLMQLEISYGGIQKKFGFAQDQVHMFMTIAPWRDSVMTFATLAKHGKKAGAGGDAFSANKRVRESPEGEADMVVEKKLVRKEWISKLEVLVERLPDILAVLKLLDTGAFGIVPKPQLVAEGHIHQHSSECYHGLHDCDEKDNRHCPCPPLHKLKETESLHTHGAECHHRLRDCDEDESRDCPCPELHK